MQLHELKIRKDAGDPRAAVCVIVETLDRMGWMLSLQDKAGLDGYELGTARGGPRVFKTLDAAWKVAKEIGFNGCRLDAWE
jgi:hypothetical protein